MTIDLDGRVTALATCKWTNSPLARREETFLTRMEEHTPAAGSVERHYFYSRSGFDGELVKLAEAQPDRHKLFTPSDFFG